MELEKQLSHDDAEVEIDLLDLAHFILRRFKYVVLAAAIGILIAGVYSFIIATPLYEATAQLYVVNSKDTALDLSDLQIGTYLTSDYELVFKTWEVNQQVKNNLNLPYSINELREMVEVTNPSDTRALFITVTSKNPSEAMYMANEYAEVAKQYIYDTMLSEMPSTLSVALEPEEPVSPRSLRNICLGALFAAFICILIMMVFYLLNDKVSTPEQLEKYTGIVPLAVIPPTGTDRVRKHRS